MERLHGLLRTGSAEDPSFYFAFQRDALAGIQAAAPRTRIVLFVAATFASDLGKACDEQGIEDFRLPAWRAAISGLVTILELATASTPELGFSKMLGDAIVHLRSSLEEV